MTRQSVVFPAPEGPVTASSFSGLDHKADGLEGRDLAESLTDIAQFDAFAGRLSGERFQTLCSVWRFRLIVLYYRLPYCAYVIATKISVPHDPVR